MSYAERASQPSPYVHAMRFSRLTFLYDGIVKWTTRETAFKRYMIERIAVDTGESILDMGCGTGTLAIAVQSLFPRVDVIGLDGDPKILEIARRKAMGRETSPRWEVGMSYHLPFENDSFSWVVTSLLFHHLSRMDKERSLAEAYRVLKPGGTMMLADWGESRGLASRSAYLMLQLMDGFENTSDNVKGLLPHLMEKARFRDVDEARRFATPLGVLSVYLAKKPVSADHAGRGGPNE